MRCGRAIPSRVSCIDFFRIGALSLAKVEYVIVDGSYTNEKKRSIFSMGDTSVPLTQLLSRSVLREAYGEGTVKVIVY